MPDREKVLKGLKYCSESIGKACPIECPYRVECLMQDELHMYSVMHDALELIKEQGETIVSLALNKENAEQTRESVKPTVDEFGNAYCVCGEHVGFFPQIHKELPEVRLNYCHSCGRKLVWK